MTDLKDEHNAVIGVFLEPLFKFKKYSSNNITNLQNSFFVNIDFTRQKLLIIDEDTEEVTELEVFVCLLGHSQHTYVEALRSQKKEDFVMAVQNALRYFGRVPKALVTDNLKSAVIWADKYEPELNETFLDFANQYGTTILPARSRKPRDKALVENAVKLVYNRIFAPLRNETFFSIGQLNFVIRDQMEKQKIAGDYRSSYTLH